MTDVVYPIVTIALSVALGYMAGYIHRLRGDNETFLLMLRQMVAQGGDEEEDGE